MKIWCIHTFLKNPKHANYFKDGMSSVSLKRGFGALEGGWCCDYPMEGQIFAYMQLRMVIMSRVKTGFTQPSGIITKTREWMLTSRYWLRIIHRWEQSAAVWESSGGFYVSPILVTKRATDVFQMSRRLKPKHHIGYVGIYIAQSSSYVWISVLVSKF